MNKEHVKSAADKASGAIKEGIGKATGDKSMEAKGKMDKAKGEAREARAGEEGELGKTELGADWGE